ncbi:hypothetical protein B0H10DRAFT_2440176 [Mycena sp. CBHHK59/15]|nr:hypothetical protein B0H10DRAFT_2440176 [Mycena sp. CBHHK59/15]
MADPDPLLVPLPLGPIRIAFLQLGDRVNAALRTQIGDRVRIQEQHGAVLQLLEAIHQHTDLIPVAECQVLEDSISCMLEALSTATVQSRTSHPPRACLCLIPSILADGAALAWTLITTSSPLVLTFPVAAVYVEARDEASGELVCTYVSSTTAPVSTLTDGELDQLMHHILEIFPTFGRRMISGHLRELGHPVPTSRIC